MPEYEVPIGEGVEVTVEKNAVRARGPKGELVREFFYPAIEIAKKDGNVIIKSKSERKKTGAIMGTWRAHVRNMVEGVSKGFECSLKMVYSHFPVKLETDGSDLVIKNFLGGRSPRRARILEGVELKIEGDTLRLSGPDKEKVGQTAANIEHATKVKGYDRRVFQDGIYVTGKPEVSVPKEGGE